MAPSFLRSRLLALGLGLLAFGTGFAADTRRAITDQDFDAWRTIGAPIVSRDGGWTAYSYMPLEGDGDVVIRSLTSEREQRVPVGALPPPPLTASEANPERPGPRKEIGLTFSSDSAFLVSTTFPTQAQTLAAKRAKKKAEELPKQGLVIVRLATGETTRIENVKSLQLPALGGAWLAYLKEPLPEKKPAESSATPSPAATSASGSMTNTASTATASTVTTSTVAPASKPAAKDAKQKEKKYGSDLVLRNLATGAERTFAHVLEYSFARDGLTLVYTVASRNEAENGVYAVIPGNPAAPTALAQGPGQYVKFTWDREEKQAAFASDRAEPNAKAPRFALYHWTRGSTAAIEVVRPGTPGLPAEFAVSGDAAASFSFNGAKLYVPATPAPKAPDERLESLLDDDKVSLDLWHWRDDYVQPVQRQRADRERKRTFLGVFDLATRRYTQLADPALQSVTANDDGTAAWGQDDRDYRLRADYDGNFFDLYLVNAAGERRLVTRELSEKSGVRWSHTGRWLAFFKQREWYAVDARNGTIIPLTRGLPVAFYDETADHPEDYAPYFNVASYGTAGWTRDGESLLLYDRFDLWQVFPDGRPARNVTNGFGRAQRIQLRVQSIEPTTPGEDRRGLDPSRPLHLRGESEDTHASGFFRQAFAATTAPDRLFWADANVRYATRAFSTDALLITSSRFDEYPDLQLTNADFAAPRKISQGGAQLAPYLWGSAELLTYRNADGVTLPAALYKPANFDPKKKYPMIVYIYERLSQVVHTFTPPLPGTVVNPPLYTSNGYLILMPDITYTVGYPGQSALKCVLPAVDEIVRRGYVDEKAIGIQGHSWGGYQIAYLLTQTDRFAAAEAGAPVGNMTSAYSGIRWGSGRPRQFQYERAQSRIGPSLQDAPLLYLENSPVFYAHRVTTPVLLLHNDHDDAVPWYQGIEYFLALRRHGKEAYLLNYLNEFHGLRRRADQRDFARRMQQFFDHHLKGAPRPDWMVRGVPFLESEEEKLPSLPAPAPAAAQP
ncbi:prolyl oligopeptidase family serine peptidase [Opitutus sp. ER46]|uniref:S9 family peptidase n=1 Tax=Opitutus sp. ER46 TaxID=2161864 RepID=UPI000D313560|nr:prolyl oligopeptidase family serine peptidase [Opitutus sp. ER46]PTX94481.1 hypothetical protein DB354_12105 [Opitutus sp. ER46]